MMVDLYVLSQWTVCVSCTDEDCLRVNKYVPTDTLVLSENPFNLTYLTGGASGVVGYETVIFGPYAVIQQAFGTYFKLSFLIPSNFL